MKIIVTGGCGFMGSHFIEKIASYYDVVNIDKMTYAANSNTQKALLNFKNYKFICGDINDVDLMNEIIKKDDIVINFAAETHVDSSITDPNIFVQSNVIGVQNLLNVSRNRVKLFIQISTDEVYGSLKLQENSSLETDILKPSSPYSASKAAAEMLCHAEYKTFGTPIIITRSSNNYGPRQNKEKLIPLFITNLMQNKKVPLYGTGNNIRNWIHVKDNCNAIFTIMNFGKIGEIYNIGGDVECSNISITEILLKNFNKDHNFISYVQDRLGHDFRYSLNSEKTKKLGWKCDYNFEVGIEQTIDWYKNNEFFWRTL